MSLSLEEYLAQHLITPESRIRIESHKEQMKSGVSLSIIAACNRYSQGQNSSVEVDLSLIEKPDEIDMAIAESVADSWDN